ncbi:class I SAM-dependent methyltransferase [Rhizobium leguminosarum]|uniref:class I SAM-dependent methyltransferase n=1 Tax=Rhizobium leguminosarum TaxID=384 RepID=UPI001C9834B6|nr:class I SAM-dependent methyltransferase [Rhizobium leguminosarum]MBY5774852.1 class I SAM-dependent methyltransferase [Rhizobium leguminosarum]
MNEFDDFIEECDRAPRLNELLDFFSTTASGEAGMPIRTPQLDHRFFPLDLTLRRFSALHPLRQGPFDKHYLSSIPYRFEEECRLGSAILKYARARKGKLKLYTLGTAEGTMARVIGEVGNGRVETLSCSPNIENLRSFYAYGVPPHSMFFHGPFHHLTPQKIQVDGELRKFDGGFDIVLEDTTFQMYSPNRFNQIRFVSQHLKNNGLFISVEKFKHDDDDEYRRRERQKDHGFKARFFSAADIRAKEETVLTQMDRNEVSLSDMGETLRHFFEHSFVTWNSGNFYTLVSSNSAESINLFLSKLCPTAIPAEYVYADLPYRLYPESEARRLSGRSWTL